MKEYNTCITMISSTEDNFNFLNLFKTDFKNYIKGIEKKENSIIISFFDNTTMEIKIANSEKTQTQLSGMINYYSKLDIENKEVLENLIRQFQISNNLMYIHFDTNNDDMRTDTIINCIYEIAREVGGILIYPNLSIFTNTGELLISKDGKSNVKSFYASAKKTKLIDDNIEFSDEDRERIEKNVNFLKDRNIPYKEDMKLIPSKSNTELSDVEMIYSNLILDYILATMSATFPGEVNQEHWDDIYFIIKSLYAIEPYMSDDYKDLLEDIRNNRPVDKIKMTWLYEKCAISMWVLGLWDFPNQYSECDVDRMNEILFSNENNKDQLPDLFLKMLDPEKKELKFSNLQMKSYEEILEKADLLNRYKWACDNAKVNNEEVDFKISMPILNNQLLAFYQILNWNPNIPIKNIEKNK